MLVFHHRQGKVQGRRWLENSSQISNDWPNLGFIEHLQIHLCHWLSYLLIIYTASIEIYICGTYLWYRKSKIKIFCHIFQVRMSNKARNHKILVHDTETNYACNKGLENSQAQALLCSIVFSFSIIPHYHNHFGHLLLTLINCNPNMDKWLHPL